MSDDLILGKFWGTSMVAQQFDQALSTTRRPKWQHHAGHSLWSWQHVSFEPETIVVFRKWVHELDQATKSDDSSYAKATRRCSPHTVRCLTFDDASDC